VDTYFSEVAQFREIAVGPTSAADYRYLPLYWTEAGRHPLFVRAGADVVGFALVRQVTQHDPFSELAEFFIQRSSRRAGIGRLAANAVWQRFPGPWQLQVALANAPATMFWRSCIEEAAAGTFSCEQFMGDDGRRLRYRFTIVPGAAEDR
jgi:predicted acetyltransferase